MKNTFQVSEGSIKRVLESNTNYEVIIHVVNLESKGDNRKYLLSIMFTDERGRRYLVQDAGKDYLTSNKPDATDYWNSALVYAIEFISELPIKINKDVKALVSSKRYEDGIVRGWDLEVDCKELESKKGIKVDIVYESEVTDLQNVMLLSMISKARDKYTSELASFIPELTFGELAKMHIKIPTDREALICEVLNSTFNDYLILMSKCVSTDEDLASYIVDGFELRAVFLAESREEYCKINTSEPLTLAEVMKCKSLCWLVKRITSLSTSCLDAGKVFNINNDLLSDIMEGRAQVPDVLERYIHNGLAQYLKYRHGIDLSDLLEEVR